MFRRFPILDFSKHRAAIEGDFCQASASRSAQEHRLKYLRSCTRVCSAKSYTALNELLNGCKDKTEVSVG